MFGSQYDTCITWFTALYKTFASEWTFIQLQTRVTALTQELDESLKQYPFVKLRLIECCPVHPSDPRNIDHLLQGLGYQHITAALATSWPSTVKHLATCTSLDKCAQHISEPSFLTHHPPQVLSSRTIKFPERLAHVSQSSDPVSSTATHARPRIGDLAGDQQEARYQAISAQ